MTIRNTTRRVRTPKIAEAGEIPSPAKRARQTAGLKATERAASRDRGMKSAGGVAGGVPKPKKSRAARRA